MGRPEHCVLFAQTFVHPQLDEYVDEVLFAEPVVITGCEFLEQNATSASQALTLVGATSPPSFAVEVFVQCEGETRFRRLCQPFLFTHSSSNVLEVEAVVTNHLVVRGSYRSLSLIIYGNTAEDLGQFNIEFDDSSVTNFVTSAVGRPEDLPLPLHSTNRTIEESLSFLEVLLVPTLKADTTVDIKKFLQLTLKVLNLSNLGHEADNIVGILISAASSFVSNDLCCEAIKQKHGFLDGSKNYEEIHHVVNEAIKELIGFAGEHESAQFLAECTFLDSEADLASSKQLVDMLNPFFDIKKGCENSENDHLQQNKNVMFGLGVALLLCSGRESCFHFVNGGGMEQIARFLSFGMQKSSAIALLLLGVIEQATRYSVGCEGFLGWWPRENENIPSRASEGYSHLLKLCLQKPRHDIASLATYVLHRLRFYEVVSRYEYAVVSVLEGLSACGMAGNSTLDMLISANLQLEKLLKLINSRGPVEDPSPVACASRLLCIGQTEGPLSYKATSSLIRCSTCCFSNWDIDTHLLELLKESGFIPLSAALLASSVLRSEVGDAMEISINISSTFGAIVLSLLLCRSGLIFLSHQPELAALLVGALKGADDMPIEECVPLRYASVLISKGFVCSPREIGMILEMHLRVINAIDRMLLLSSESEEFLWVLWELCGLSRSDCGRQALLILCYFPEALKALIEALNSVNEGGPSSKDSGTSPLNVAIFHSAAEILEIIVTDSTSSSLSSWIECALELQKALHCSPGSNRKDAPTRLLEYIDAGVVYRKNGGTGIIRYAAVLASGGDAHLSATSISDVTDAENADGDSSASPDLNVVDNLGKLIYEKTFEGVNLRDSSVAQLTTAMRILAFISENSTVAAALYDEGSITVIYAVLLNCKFMFESFSNSYDYLVDEGTEGNSTSDLLVERYREQSLVDLLVPSLILLITLLHKLKEANEQHRNTRLMNALLRLHREVSTKLAACAADLSSPYPESALGFGALNHLIVSALSCWPVYGWTPGLFHSLKTSVEAASFLSLGPKEACSLLCLLNDLFPEEGIWLWKTEMPLLDGLRTMAVETVLGPRRGRLANWYLDAGNHAKLLCQLTTQLETIAQIVQHYAISELVVLQDMLRVLIARVACQNAQNASLLLRPILSWIHDRVSDFSSPSDMDSYKVYRFLNFIASLLEHPCTKALVLEEDGIPLLLKVLKRCFHEVYSDGITYNEKGGFTLISWCLPVFKSFTLLCNSQASLLYPGRLDNDAEMSSGDCSLLLCHILKFCQVLPIGKELLYCLNTFKELGSCYEGRRALITTVHCGNSDTVELETERQPESDEQRVSDIEWSKSSPLLCCWKRLMKSVDTEDVLPTFALESINTLCLGFLRFCTEGKSLDVNAISAIKCLFGLPSDAKGTDEFPEENLKFIHEMINVLRERMSDGDYMVHSGMQKVLYQVSESASSLLFLLEKNTDLVEIDDVFSKDNVLLRTKENSVSQMLEGIAEKADDFSYMELLGDKFMWECPETLPDRLSQTALSGKRKMPPLEAPGRRMKEDTTTQSSFSRGSAPPPISSGPTRRDVFRQRKPNTSRPPSMHVDDYVARERNVDGNSGSNVIAIQRLGSSSGRPPSIHVDEFMARQRERQNPMAVVVGEVSEHAKNVAPVNSTDNEKANKSKQLKPDLDDDLQGIDIVFDAEENETDDKLPFPQPDDNLLQSGTLAVEQSSPHSIVEETENDTDEVFSRAGTPVVSYGDENTSSELSSKMSMSRPENPLTREASVSSDKKFSMLDAGASSTSGFLQLGVDSRMMSQNFYAKNSPQNARNMHAGVGSQGHYNQKMLPNQPPLPPMPHPHVHPELTQGRPSSFVNTLSDGKSQILTPYQVQSEYSRTIPPSSGSARPPPPLPPTPPPFSSSSYNMVTVKTSVSQYNHMNSGTSDLSQTSISSAADTRLANFSAALQTSFPPLMTPSLFTRPPHSIVQLQPLQRPQPVGPLQSPQHIRLPVQQPSQQQLNQLPTQNAIQMQMHQIQMMQQPQASSSQIYFQSQQPEFSQVHAQQQQQQQQGNMSLQQQQDSAMSLEEFIAAAGGIQALLSDKEKLCQFLEQHPKLVEMLQEKLGQL